jgi:hypothetical protein
MIMIMMPVHRDEELILSARNCYCHDSHGARRAGTVTAAAVDLHESRSLSDSDLSDRDWESPAPAIKGRCVQLELEVLDGLRQPPPESPGLENFDSEFYNL